VQIKFTSSQDFAAHFLLATSPCFSHASHWCQSEGSIESVKKNHKHSISVIKNERFLVLFLAKITFINLSEAMEAMAGRSERDVNALAV
jgi:hypothetical protein